MANEQRHPSGLYITGDGMGDPLASHAAANRPPKPQRMSNGQVLDSLKIPNDLRNLGIIVATELVVGCQCFAPPANMQNNPKRCKTTGDYTIPAQSVGYDYGKVKLHGYWYYGAHFIYLPEQPFCYYPASQATVLRPPNNTPLSRGN